MYYSLVMKVFEEKPYHIFPVTQCYVTHEYFRSMSQQERHPLKPFIEIIKMIPAKLVFVNSDNLGGVRNRGYLCAIQINQYGAK